MIQMDFHQQSAYKFYLIHSFTESINKQFHINTTQNTHTHTNQTHFLNK